MFRSVSVPISYGVAVAVALLLCFLYAPVSAQQQGIDPLFIDVQPQSPTPGAQTTITIDSSSVDLSQATIRWSVNGVSASSGSGIRTFTFTMGPVGKSTIITLSVAPTTGTPFTRTFTFTPGSVTMLWEAETYVPPFFAGKSLYTPGALVRIVAVPDVRDASGNPIAPSDLNFKWQISGDAHADLSGLGRDTLNLTGNWGGGTEEVIVDVLRKDGVKAAQGVLFIKDERPVVVLYKKDPLRGVLYERALTGSERLTEAETTIVVEPYYLSGKNKVDPTHQYSWTLNGNSITPQGNDPTMLTLRQNSGQLGNASLTLSVQNTDVSKLLQAAETTLMLILGGQSSNFFGL